MSGKISRTLDFNLYMNINPSSFFINQIFVSLHVHTINNLETVIHTVIVIDEEL